MDETKIGVKVALEDLLLIFEGVFEENAKLKEHIESLHNGICVVETSPEVTTLKEEVEDKTSDWMEECAETGRLKAEVESLKGHVQKHIEVEDALQSQLDDSEERLTDFRRLVSDLDKQLDKANEEIARLHQVDVRAVLLAEITGELDKANAHIEEGEIACSISDNRLTEAEKKLDKANEVNDRLHSSLEAQRASDKEIITTANKRIAEYEEAVRKIWSNLKFKGSILEALRALEVGE